MIFDNRYSSINEQFIGGGCRPCLSLGSHIIFSKCPCFYLLLLCRSRFCPIDPSIPVPVT